MLPCAQKAKALQKKATKQVGVQINNRINKTMYKHRLNILKKEITTFLNNVSHHHLKLHLPVNKCDAEYVTNPFSFLVRLHLGELASTSLVVQAVLEFNKLRRCISCYR